MTREKQCFTFNYFYLLIGVIFFIEFLFLRESLRFDSLLAVLFKFIKVDLGFSTIFSTITLCFSYGAYQFAKEKFRLDLLDKRWEVYVHVLDFCSVVSSQGTLTGREDNIEVITTALQAAEQSFRGIGLHKTRALFGEDIQVLFEQLNEGYAYLSSFSESPSDPTERTEWAKRKNQHVRFTHNTAGKLPEHFKSYVYFGDYKNTSSLMSAIKKCKLKFYCPCIFSSKPTL